MNPLQSEISRFTKDIEYSEVYESDFEDLLKILSNPLIEVCVCVCNPYKMLTVFQTTF